MNSNLPNLYTAFDLDRSDDSETLGLVLSARDLRLEQMGVTQDDPRRTQTVMAFSVLSDPVRRAAYDEKIEAGVPLSWAQIQHLGNFGTIPDAPGGHAPTPGMNQTSTSPFQQNWQQPSTPQPEQQNFGYTYGDPTTQFAHNSYNPINDQVNASMFGGTSFSHTPAMNSFGDNMMNVERPTAGMRLWMAVLDLLMAGIASSIVVGIIGMDEFLGWLLGAILMVVYVVGFESIKGATPAKMFYGYEVRDINTHSRLSAGAASKRNWWKFLNLVPAIGGLASFIMAAVYASSINESNQMRGGHDKLANAEVVKKI